MINSRFLRQHLIKRSRKLCVTRCKSTAASSNEWETVVGLEVHAQLNTESKLFSGAQNVFGGVVNSCVSLFDASIPGTLPVLNRRCVELAVMTSLALGCRVNEVSSFDRKHYFYADLPNGYQITQQRAPIANDGVINFQVFTPGIHKKPYQKSSRIKQIQLEQDSGKSLHDEELKRSLVDLNRAGAPLIELVFEPDLQDGEEAAALVKELLLVLRRLRASGGRQQEGALRVDANVSVRRPGGPLGTRTEIKNIGSVRGVAGAVRHEARRQRALLARGGRVRGETRAWDAAARVTVPLRDKEEVLDYRYMPEPNLPPLWVNLHSTADSEDVVSVPLIRDSIPELPEETRRNLIDNFHLRPETAIQLVNEPKLLDYFQSLTTEGRDPVKVANLLINELLTAINKARVEPDLCSVPEEHLAQLTDLLLDRKVNLEVVRKTLDELLVEGNEKSPLTIIEENSWLLVGDDEEITRLCMEIIEGNPKLVKQYRQGKVKVFNALLGIFAKNTQNRVDMARASQRLEELLKSDE